LNRSDFEKYLGKMVTIKLFDGEVIKGYLRKTHDESLKSNPNLYLPINYYFLTESSDLRVCNSVLFRVSHVSSIK